MTPQSTTGSENTEDTSSAPEEGAAGAEAETAEAGVKDAEAEPVESTVDPEEPEVVDIMTALKASIDAAKESKKPMAKASGEKEEVQKAKKAS